MQSQRLHSWPVGVEVKNITIGGEGLGFDLQARQIEHNVVYLRSFVAQALNLEGGSRT